MKNERHQTIIALIEKYRIETQEELAGPIILQEGKKYL